MFPIDVLRFSEFKTMRNHLSETLMLIRVITKLPNSEQSYKGKVKTHNYINRQNQSTTGKMLNDIQITSDYMSRWVALKRRVGAVTNQRVLNVLFYVNILQRFFVVENFTANAVSVAIGDNGKIDF
jgi:hypothetical protein